MALAAWAPRRPVSSSCSRASLVHAPAVRVPENSLKFGVGVMLTSFGMFWTAEGAGASGPAATWPSWPSSSSESPRRSPCAGVRALTGDQAQARHDEAPQLGWFLDRLHRRRRLDDRGRGRRRGRRHRRRRPRREAGVARDADHGIGRARLLPATRRTGVVSWFRASRMTIRVPLAGDPGPDTGPSCAGLRGGWSRSWVVVNFAPAHR